VLRALLFSYYAIGFITSTAFEKSRGELWDYQNMWWPLSPRRHPRTL